MSLTSRHAPQVQRVLAIGNMYPPHDLGGGYEITWRSWVGYARARGDVVRVLTTDWRRPDLPDDVQEDDEIHRELRWYWRDHEFPRMGLRERTTIERHNAGVLERHLQEFKPEAIAWWGMGGMSLSLIERVRRAGLPAVGVVGDEWLRWGPRADAWTKPFRNRPRLAAVAERVTRLPVRPDLAKAALWLFNSETVRANALGDHPDLTRTAVVHPGIDERIFTAAPEREWQWRLLYLGRMDRRKGVHLAIEALAHLPEEASLVLQGTGDQGYLDELREIAKEFDVADRLTFSQGPRNEIPAVYAAADAVLFPVQWEEPWGLVPLEAMAVGRPVVATGTGGSGEYLRDGENCLLFTPRDSAQALAESVRRLEADPGLRGHLREGGIATAERFTETAYNEAISAALAKGADSLGGAHG